ncbi:MAG: PspA/IM30 family protein [Clostridia bacterium]|nr:MAG: PspA/IM30 family protein [Clostridia bacterium]
MSLFKRIRDVSLANINALLDKAEDPVKMLDQYLRDMEEDIADAETGVAKQIALEKRLKQQVDEAREMTAKREQQAVQALESDREDLARRALEEKQTYETKVKDIESQWIKARASADSLRDQLRQMKSEYDKLRAKRDTLVARAEAAKAQKKIQEAFSGIGSATAREGFDRMEEKVLQLEAEAEAAGEMRAGETDLDRELAELAKPDVEAELAALKARVQKKAQ